MFVDVIVLVVRFFVLLIRAVADALEKIVVDVLAYRTTGMVTNAPAPVKFAEKQESKETRKFGIEELWKYVKVILFVLYLMIYILALFGFIPSTIAPEKVLEFFNLMDTS